MKHSTQLTELKDSNLSQYDFESSLRCARVSIDALVLDSYCNCMSYCVSFVYNIKLMMYLLAHLLFFYFYLYHVLVMHPGYRYSAQLFCTLYEYDDASSVFDKWFYPKHRSFYAVFIQRYILQKQTHYSTFP